MVHLAALSNDPLGEISPDLTYDINLNSSLKAARLAKTSGVERFVFASSCSIYGASGDVTIPLDESAPTRPVSAYAISKVKTEEGLHALADKTFSPVYMRNATAYGVSARTRLDLVLNNLMAFAHATGQIRVMSDGTPWRAVDSHRGHRLAVVAALSAPREVVHDQAFNIGRDDANYQVRDIAEAVKRVVPTADLIITGETGGDSRSYRVNFTKALARYAGSARGGPWRWVPEELDRWFRNGGLADQAFDSRRFVRLKQLRHLMDTGAVDESLRARVPL